MDGITFDINLKITEMYGFLQNRRYNQYIDRQGNATFLFWDVAEVKYYVVSFDAQGICNNCATYVDKREAWRLFCDLIHPDLEYESDGRSVEAKAG
jgi:hypothetical protein